MLLVTTRVAAEEPRLTIRSQPVFWTARFGKRFGVAAGIAVAGVVSLVLSGNLLLPFQPIRTFEGKTASKGELFQDEQMQRLLRRHHIAVRITRDGSMNLWEPDLEKKYDFAFPSGQPAAEAIRRAVAGRKLPEPSKPFASPIVLATFRQYADTLVAAGIATPQGDPRTALYYTLDVTKFLAAVGAGKTWDALNLGAQKDAQGNSLSSGNRIVAHIPGTCRSNSGQAFVALSAFAWKNRDRAPTAADVSGVAAEIKGLFDVQGLPDTDPFDSYTTPEGKGKAPIIVVYEHQFLAYQSSVAGSAGRPDGDRVLLYPDSEILTDPEFIPLNPEAEELGRLLMTDPAIRQRAMELGYRMKGKDRAVNSDALWQYLKGRNIPAPVAQNTHAELPDIAVLDELVSRVKVTRCPR